MKSERSRHAVSRSRAARRRQWRRRTTPAPQRRRAHRRRDHVRGDHGAGGLDVLQPPVLDAVLGGGHAVRLPGLRDRAADRGQRHRRDGARAAERRRLLHLRHARDRAARRLRHGRPDVRRLRAAAAGRGGADRLLPAEHVPRRVRRQHPVVADRPRPGRPDGVPRLRGHPLLAAHRARAVHGRGRDRRAAGGDRRRQGRPQRADAASADARRLAARLQRAHDRVRVRGAQLRRLRGGDHARRRDARAAPHRPARGAVERRRRRRALRLLHLGGGRRPRRGEDQRARRLGDPVERPRRDLRLVDEVAGDRRLGLEHVRGDDQLVQRHRADPQHDGPRGPAAADVRLHPPEAPDARARRVRDRHVRGRPRAERRGDRRRLGRPAGRRQRLRLPGLPAHPRHPPRLRPHQPGGRALLRRHGAVQPDPPRRAPTRRRRADGRPADRPDRRADGQAVHVVPLGHRHLGGVDGPRRAVAGPGPPGPAAARRLRHGHRRRPRPRDGAV